MNIEWTQIKVKPAIKTNENHKHQIWKIFNQNIEYNFKTKDKVSYEDHSEWWKRAFDREYMYVISYKTDIIGYIRLTKTRTENKEKNEISIAIEPKFQGLGVASYILKKFEACMREKGVNQIIALVNNRNEKGKRFFEKNEFKKRFIRYVKKI